MKKQILMILNLIIYQKKCIWFALLPYDMIIGINSDFSLFLSLSVIPLKKYDGNYRWLQRIRKVIFNRNNHIMSQKFNSDTISLMNDQVWNNQALFIPQVDRFLTTGLANLKRSLPNISAPMDYLPLSF